MGFSLIVATGLLSSCSAPASQCGGLSCCGKDMLVSVAVAHGLSSCNFWALENYSGSVVGGTWA